MSTTTAPGRVYSSGTLRPARNHGETARRIARGLGEVLITLGLIILLFALYEVYGKTEIVNAHQKTLEQQLTQQWAAPGSSGKSGATPSDPQPLPGDAFARLYLPVLQKHWVIVQGVSLADIEFAPGHYPGTAMPGQVGNFSVAGHRIPSIFWNLQELTKGQQIVVQTRDDWYVYTVVSQEAVLPTAIKVIAPVPDQIGAAPTRAMMTLTTCNPKWADYQRLVVHAVLTKTAPAKDGPPIALGELTNMYAWLWRKLPYGPAGKIAGLAVALAGIVGLLWFGVFPIVDRHLPNNNVQITQPAGDSVSVPPTPSVVPSTRVSTALPK